MKAPTVGPGAAGFTLIELLITLALVGLISIVAMPLHDVTATRAKESELREALRTIRTGIDAYKAATDSGLLPRVAGESGYPPTLQTLTESLEMASSPSASGSDATQRMVILRRLPRDPFFPDAQVPADQTWAVRSYASRPDDPQPGADVFDVSSKSSHAALDGSLYSSW